MVLIFFFDKKSENCSLLFVKIILYNGELNGIWLYDWDRMIRELGVGVLFRDLIISTKCKLFVGNSEKDILSDSGSLEFGIGSV